LSLLTLYKPMVAPAIVASHKLMRIYTGGFNLTLLFS